MPQLRNAKLSYFLQDLQSINDWVVNADKSTVDGNFYVHVFVRADNQEMARYIAENALQNNPLSSKPIREVFNDGKSIHCHYAPLIEADLQRSVYGHTAPRNTH